MTVSDVEDVEKQHHHSPEKEKEKEKEKKSLRFTTSFFTILPSFPRRPVSAPYYLRTSLSSVLSFFLSFFLSFSSLSPSPLPTSQRLTLFISLLLPHAN